MDRIAAARVAELAPAVALLERLDLFETASPATSRRWPPSPRESRYRLARSSCERATNRRPARDRVRHRGGHDGRGRSYAREPQGRRLLRRDRIARAATSHRLRHGGDRVGALSSPRRGLLAHRRTKACASRRRWRWSRTGWHPRASWRNLATHDERAARRRPPWCRSGRSSRLLEGVVLVEALPP